MRTTDLIKKTSRYLLREAKYIVSGKPYFLNYPTATLCNHKCVMCNIHEIKQRDEVSIKGLDEILSDPLFDNIESIGLSGGEPFMKKDLVEVIAVLVSKLKSLQHFSINSNGQLPNRIKEWLPEIKKLCEQNKVQFNMVLSMDGVGEIHNEVRGRPNAWGQLESSFGHIKGNGMVPSILMTIHKRNYQDVFNVYAYSLSNGIVPYFGVATVIERLGNEHIHDQFAISQKDRYYIWEFYQNLSRDKRFGINKRIWYDMLSYQMLYGLQRKASCVAKNKGVYLSDSGKISYCGVYDKELQKFDHPTLLKRFLDKRNDIGIRQKMIDKHCNSCMHDYQSKPTSKDIYRYFINQYNLPQAKRVLRGEIYRRFNSKNNLENKKVKVKNILLYGWFGTETIGDKAIYGEIIRYFKEYFDQDVHFTIASNMRAYTERTLIELNLEKNDIKILTIDEIKGQVGNHDLFVYCGGPIMGYSDLYDHYEIVNKANRLGKYTMIYGAGFSPIKKALYKKVALSMIEQNDLVVLRDSESLETVNKGLGGERSLRTNIIDPAYIWAMNQKAAGPKTEVPTLGISFRVFPNDNFLGCTIHESLNRRIEAYIKIANEFIQENDGHVVLVPMNSYHVGGDDRKALYLIYQGIENKEKASLLSGYYSPKETLEHFATCHYFIGMRFHSSVFANALTIPTVGVEYVLPKGKVTHLYNKLGLGENLINIKNLDYGILKEKLNYIIENKEKIKLQLKQLNKQFLEEYESTLKTHIDRMLDK
ncbi:radical SAM protein [Flagellimonas taeanensis]|uniref:polysaccharide pyruvyl transferase family protein n=1 Tax=Flavobacteriaceae TaxID=49546 RepID=UPI000E6A350C|nr:MULTISPECIES: polysaccharide pyruvyl transferase family protein [Allomuricauda]MDC6385464.1 polysaccharide pyruvyl transferase family protein [Muricauda sp. SK9]RIV53028.1 radical SAM protein [Allomuricauda taeanensis]